MTEGEEEPLEDKVLVCLEDSSRTVKEPAPKKRRLVRDIGAPLAWEISGRLRRKISSLLDGGILLDIHKWILGQIDIDAISEEELSEDEMSGGD